MKSDLDWRGTKGMGGNSLGVGDGGGGGQEEEDF